MNSRIKFYNVDFTPEKNALIDGFDTYISSLPVEYESSIQFIKDLDLDLSVTIYESQANLKNLYFNYACLEQNYQKYYFFVMNSNWKAEQTLEIVLSMDTINTFNQELLAPNAFDPRTKVMRQHKDRFIKEDVPVGHVYLTPIVDVTDEGFSVPQYADIDHRYFVVDHSLDEYGRWYLVYNTDYSESPNKPIKCYVVADEHIEFNGTGGPLTVVPSDLPAYEEPGNTKDGKGWTGYAVLAINNGAHEFWDDRDNHYVSTTEETYFFYRNQNNQITVINVLNKSGEWYAATEVANSLRMDATIEAATFYSVYGDPDVLDLGGSWYQMVKNASTTIFVAGISLATLDTFKDIDRTLSTLVKIIELPYAPVSFTQQESNLYKLPLGWSITHAPIGANGSKILALEVKDLDYEFENFLGDDPMPYTDVIVDDLPTRALEKNSNEYEPKLYHSNFFTNKYYYDSFSKTFPREDYSAPDVFSITFKPSNALSSTLLFDIENTTDQIRARSDYDNILMCRRNNEVPLFSSDYLNYLRTGYNFDVKAKDNASAQRWANFRVNAVTSTITALSGLATGGLGRVAGVAFAGNALTSLTNTIYADINAENEFQAKQQQLQAQSASVTTNEDLDLFHYYSHKPILQNLHYIPSTEMSNKLYDLFRLTGYKNEDTNIAPDLTSRRSYNFVQCEAIFTNEEEPEWKPFLDDIKARFEAGVTVYHPFVHQLVDGLPGGPATYDFEQEFENWENWICPKEGHF